MFMSVDELRTNVLSQTRPDDAGGSSEFALPLCLGIACIVGVISFLARGNEGLVLLYVAVFPIILILTGLRFRKGECIELSLYLEMFLLGCGLSVVIAALLESIFQKQTSLIWICQASPKRFTWQCDTLFVVMVVFCVGLSEEFAKLVPLTRIRRQQRHLPRIGRCWFRHLDTPMGILLAGCASGGGFACVENMKYVSSLGGVESSFGVALRTALARGVMAVPMHVACTGYASSKLVENWFGLPSVLSSTQPAAVALEQRQRRTPALRVSSEYVQIGSSSTGGEAAGCVDSVGSFSPLTMVPQNGVVQWSSEESLVCEHGHMASCLNILAVPVVCHGLYDAGLMLAHQFIQYSAIVAKCLNGHPPPLTLLVTSLASVLSFGRSREVDHANCSDSNSQSVLLYTVLGLFSLLVAFMAYLTAITLFVRRWRWVRDIQNVAIPKLDRCLAL